MRNFLIGIAWLFLAAVIAVVSFMLKNEVVALENRLEKTNEQTIKNQETIHILRAEWSYLNDPGRIRKLAEKYAHMRPMKAEQFITFSDVPFKGKANTANNKKKEGAR